MVWLFPLLLTDLPHSAELIRQHLLADTTQKQTSCWPGTRSALTFHVLTVSYGAPDLQVVLAC